ncbi:hypothetical protein [Algoriphagus pacificus]|uniref:Uncharacterized protein n=1 Tax=Algoriphagus pacificus TaxID=2811234 RepID=A0ABS3CNM5_9BACT|nr:hypothetical protein [Algoriphagus pacificus]MBN7817771.1 hypothetical protein [Algoriphagus pacificus]
MNKLSKLLPALALVLGAFAAVAFTSPQPATGEYGLSGSVWYDVTGINPDEDTYVCNEDETRDCLFDQPFGMGTPISSEQDKVFVVQNASNLPIAH